MNVPPFFRSVLGVVARSRWAWAIAAVSFSAVSALGLATWLTNVTFPKVAPPAQSSEVLAYDGQVIASLHAEQDRRIVPLNQISRNLQIAVLSAEDRNFFKHSGMSVKSIVRAAGANLLGGGIRQGGSTITQQYVRNALPDIGMEKRFTRKMKEAFWAIQLERFQSKREILERYLNTVYFGRGAYGAEAAARTYFKTSSSRLTLGQAAFLAGIIRAPERFQIDEDPKGAVNLRNTVLEGLLNSGTINQKQAAAARKEDLKLQFKPGQSIEVESARAGFFVEYVRRTLKNQFKLSDAEILRGGLRIRTTLDLNAQDAAEAAVREVLNQPGDPEAALVAMGPGGQVRAMVGGREVDSLARARGFNFAADVNERGGGRQAGSAFKPFALAAFLDEGKSLSSTFPGTSPLTISSGRCRNKDGTPWEVANFEQGQFASLDVTGATLSSVNTIYAQIMNTVVTPSKFIKMAAKAGIEIPASDAGCALVLGTTDVTPLEMARAYTTFAQRGSRPDPLVVTRISRPNGQVIAERFPSVQTVIDRNIADSVNYVLALNVQGGTGVKAKFGRPAAGKTGTTQNYANAWFAGYTPELTAVVWMGYAPDPGGKIPEMSNVRGEPVTGGSLPALIWKRFMAATLKGVRATGFNKPTLDGVVMNLVPSQPGTALTQAPRPGASPPVAGMLPVKEGSAATGPGDENSTPLPVEPPKAVRASPAPVFRQDRPPAPNPEVTAPCFPFCPD